MQTAPARKDAHMAHLRDAREDRTRDTTDTSTRDTTDTSCAIRLASAPYTSMPACLCVWIYLRCMCVSCICVYMYECGQTYINVYDIELSYDGIECGDSIEWSGITALHSTERYQASE